MRPSGDPRYLDQAAACPQSAWTGDPARCRWCDRPALAERAWCSTLCEDEYRRNHWWDAARLAALARDDHRCVECGRGPATVTEGKWLLRALLPIDAVAAARLWHSPAWQRFNADCQVEVHHLDPRHGAGYGSGCHHHVDGLVTLCHRHHAETTVRQRGARRAG